MIVLAQLYLFNIKITDFNDKQNQTHNQIQSVNAIGIIDNKY